MTGLLDRQSLHARGRAARGPGSRARSVVATGGEGGLEGDKVGGRDPAVAVEIGPEVASGCERGEPDEVGRREGAVAIEVGGADVLRGKEADAGPGGGVVAD